MSRCPHCRGWNALVETPPDGRRQSGPPAHRTPASTILRNSRKTVPPELFDYLLSASPIRDYALEPKITKFY